MCCVLLYYVAQEHNSIDFMRLFRVVGQCTDKFLVQDSNYQAFGCCERSEKICGLVCSRIFLDLVALSVCGMVW